MSPQRTLGRDRLAPGGMDAAVLPETLPARLAYGLLLFLLVAAPWQYSSFWLASYNYWPQILFLIQTVLAGLMMGLSGIQRRKFDLLDWLVLGFGLWCGLSYLTSVYRHDSLLELSRVAGILVWFYIARAFLLSGSGERKLPWLTLAAMLGVAIVAAQAVFNYFQTRDPRQFGTYITPNLLANGVAMALPFALISPVILRRQFGAPTGAIGILFTLLLAAGLVVTSSKGGFASALVGLLVTAVAVAKSRPQAVGQVVRRYWWVLAIGLVAVGLLAMKTVIPRLQSSFGANDYSTLFRVYTWKSTWDMALARPILGHGAGAFQSAFPQYAEAGYTRHAHQQWLQVAAEYGFPALLLLVAACVVAFISGWKQLKTANWPYAAAAIGSLVAFVLHGCTDSGWSVTSIAVLFVLCLAVLGGTAVEPSAETAVSRLSYSWLAATLLLLGGTSITFNAFNGEDSLVESERFLQTGAPSRGLEVAREAVASDPGSSRTVNQLARALMANGQPDEALKYYAQATEILPIRASNWMNVAVSKAQMGDIREAEAAFARALAMDPKNTTLLFERAGFRLQSKDSRGYTDLEEIIRLWDEPYGKYAAIPEFVNLDFTRATFLLLPQWEKQGNTAKMKQYLAKVAVDLENARRNEARNRLIATSVGEITALPNSADLAELEANLNSWQERLRSAKVKP